MPAWPTVTDDTGDKISGTIFNKALTDAMKAYLDGLVVSGTNPGVSAANIIDEVVAARGTKASLDARMDVALNEDGTPKAVAGQATTTEVGRQINGRNFARNPYMREWSDGATVAPDYYTLSGAGAPAIQQCGTGLGDGTQVGAGRYTARVTSDVANATQLQQMVIASTEMDDFVSLRGRKVNFAVRAQASGASIYRLVITDGVNTSTSGYNTTGVDEDLSYQHTIAATATYLQVAVEVKLGTNQAYIGAFYVSFGDVLPTRWSATGVLEPYRPDVGEQLVVAKNIAGSIAGVNPTFTWSMPANTLAMSQSRLYIEASGGFTASANNKAVDIFLNGVSIRVIPLAAHNIANNVWSVKLTIVRTGSTTAVLEGFVMFDSASLAAPTVNHIATAFGAGPNFATAQNVQVQVNCAAGEGTIARVFMRVEP